MIKKYLKSASTAANSNPSLGAPYLFAHACFDCRVSFKMAGNGDHKCPNCGEPIHRMGRDFRPPKRTDREQWLKVQTLYAFGFRFYRYSGSYEPLPERLRDVRPFIARNPDHPLRYSEASPELLPCDS